MQLTTPIPPSRKSYNLSGSVKWIPPAKGDLKSCPIKSLHLFFTFCLLSFFYSTCSPPRTQEIEKPVPAEPVVSKFYLWVIKAQVNVRDKNSEKAAVITQLTEGDSVLVFENRNGWYRIRTNENRAGWIRTDLLGPRHLSIFLRAVSFSDSLRDQEGIDLYFDKKLQHKRIYLSLPVFYYSSREKAETKAREIIENFQKSVYNGEVTLRVLKPDSRDEFLSISETGQSNPEPVLPVLPFGILKEVRVKSSREISLLIMIPDGTGDTDLLLAARSMAAAYPLSFTRVEIQFNDNRNQCRMWFQEGQDGERYRFHPCKS
jgi:hypothetical protein